MLQRRDAPFSSPTVPLQLTLLLLMVCRGHGRRVYAKQGPNVRSPLPPLPLRPVYPTTPPMTVLFTVQDEADLLACIRRIDL